MDFAPFLTVQFAVAFSVLAVGSFYDIFNNMTIPNRVWLVGGVVGAILAAWQYGFSVLLVANYSVAIILGLAVYCCWRFFGDMIGGADVKAVAALGLILGPFVFGAVAFSAFGAAMLLVGYLVSKRIKFSEIREVKVPFIPILTAGLLVWFLLLLWA